MMSKDNVDDILHVAHLPLLRAAFHMAGVPASPVGRGRQSRPGSGRNTVRSGIWGGRSCPGLGSDTSPPCPGPGWAALETPLRTHPLGVPILAWEGLGLDPPGDHEGVLLEPPHKGPTPHRATLTLQVGAVAPRATV